MPRTSHSVGYNVLMGDEETSVWSVHQGCILEANLLKYNAVFFCWLASAVAGWFYKYSMWAKTSTDSIQKQPVYSEEIFFGKTSHRDFISDTSIRIVKLTWRICLLSNRVMWVQKRSKKSNSQEAKTVISEFEYFQGFVCKLSNHHWVKQKC